MCEAIVLVAATSLLLLLLVDALCVVAAFVAALVVAALVASLAATLSAALLLLDFQPLYNNQINTLINFSNLEMQTNR